MRYVKIKASTYNEAMAQLKIRYGDEAMPISHKLVKDGGLFNTSFFAKDVVELTAAIQDKSLKKDRSLSEKNSRIDFTVGRDDFSSGRNARKLNETIDMMNSNLDEIKASSPAGKLSGIIREKEALGRAVPEAASSAPAGAGKDFEKEFDEIRNALKQLLDDRDNANEKKKIASPHKSEEAIIEAYKEILYNNDFSPAESENIMLDVRNSVSRDDLKDKYKIEKTFKELLKSRIATTGPIKSSGRKKVVVFIGPTGVGKTTTMAKLGAVYSIRENKQVSFITMDNYRIAATEQLKKYAEIMRIPIDVVNDQAELRKVILESKSEIIMVDTSGRSHRNDLKISEMKNIVDEIDCDMEKILCVSANIKRRDADAIFKSFDIMNFDSVIITKVDETSFVGNIVNVADKYKKPISYFTNGQEVPNDIVIADSEKIVDMMIGESKHA